MQFSLLPDGYFPDLFSLPDHFNPSVYIGYFKEKINCNFWTLSSSIGFHNIANKSPRWRVISDPLTGTFIGANDFKTSYELMLEAGVEPRRYWSFNHKHPLGKVHLNSGWFLSFPLVFQTVLLHTPEPFIHQGWFPNVLYSGTFLFIPSIGYRHAISKQFFIESSIGFGTNVTLVTNSIDNRITVLNPELYPVFKLKTAYTF